MKCVLMDCISENGNIFYASSLDSAQVCKRTGEIKQGGERRKNESARAREEGTV